IDGVHFSLELAAQQILQNSAAYGAGTTGRANHSHRRGSKHHVQAIALERRLILFFRWQPHEISAGRTHTRSSPLDGSPDSSAARAVPPKLPKNSMLLLRLG